MRRYLILAMTCWAIAAFGLIALAAPAPLPAAPSWHEHADLMAIVIGSLLSLVLFFFLRTLMKIDRNQNRLFEKLDAVCKQVDTLQGEHNMMKSLCAAAKHSARGGGERPD